MKKTREKFAIKFARFLESIAMTIREYEEEKEIIAFIRRHNVVAYSVYHTDITLDGNKITYPMQIGYGGTLDESRGCPRGLMKEHYNALRHILAIPANTDRRKFYIPVEKLVNKYHLPYVGEFELPKGVSLYD